MMEQVKVARRGSLEHFPSDHAMESDSNETDGLYPLVQSFSNVTRPFGVEMMEERKYTHLPDCLTKWRFLATCLLTALVASMFLMRHWEVNNRPPMSLESEMPQDCMGWPSDHLACAMMYNISFSKSLDRISNTLDLNDAEFPPEWPDDRICISRLRPHRYVDEFHSVYWDAAFDRNKKLARNSSSTSELDVVLLGDSITEHWLGTELSIPDPAYDGIRNVFQRYFRRQEGADVEGMALGISGDRCPQLQYRIRNGEMPSTLNPKVWWILIGTNDLYDRCTAESILFGIIGIVQEIQRRRPSATVVVNSILPRPGDGLGTLQGYLWNHITWINERLHCYTEGTEGVHFFDATTIFLQDNGHSINQTLMPDLLHPSAAGCELWAAEIVKKVKELKET